MEIDASSTYVRMRAIHFLPYNDNEEYLGGSTTVSGGELAFDKTWKYIGGQIIDAKDVYKINNITCIDQSSNDVYFVGNNAVHIQGAVGTDDIKTTSSRIDLYHDVYVAGSVNLTGNLVLSNYASITVDDSGGTARTLTVKYNATLGVYILST
jgi:hypothetical protein